MLPITTVSSERPEGDNAALVVSRNQAAKKKQTIGSKIRVLVADDHAVVRQGLCSLLAGYDGIVEVGEAAKDMRLWNGQTFTT